MVRPSPRDTPPARMDSGSWRELTCLTEPTDSTLLPLTLPRLLSRLLPLSLPRPPLGSVPPPPAPPAPVSAPLDYDYVDVPVDPNFNPFINPHDPNHRDFQFNTNGAKFAPQSSGAVTNQFLASVPNCANCAGVNPFVNPFDASHTNAGLLAGHQAGFQARQPAQPVQQAVQPAFRPQQPRQPALSTFITTTPAPKRFFPPGQLKP